MKHICTSCNLSNTVRNQFFPEKKKAELAFVFPNPNHIKEDYKLILDLCSELGINKEEIFITTLLKCPVKNSKKVEKEYYLSCEENLVKELEVVKPKGIMLLGVPTVESLLDYDSKFSSIVGKIKTFGDYKVICSYPPAYFKHRNNDFSQIKNFIEYLYTEISDSVGGVLKTTLIKTQQELNDLYNLLYDADIFAYDFETLGLNFGDRIIGCSFAVNRTEGYYLPILQYNPLFGWADYEIRNENSDTEKFIDLRDFLVEVLTNLNAEKIAQNSKFELGMFRYEYGLDIKNQVHDTAVIHYLLNQHLQNHSLETISELYPEFYGYKETIKQFKKVGWEKIPLKDIAKYGALDSVLTFRYWEDYYPEMPDNMREIAYKQIMNPYMHLVADMERTGMVIDLEYLKELKSKLEIEIKTKVKNIQKMAGYDINPGSSTQLRKYLYEERKLPAAKYKIKKGKSGYSTDEASLTLLAEKTNDPALLQIVDYRKAVKAKSTFVEHLEQFAVPFSETRAWYHPNWKVTRTATGRLASGSEA